MSAHIEDVELRRLVARLNATCALSFRDGPRERATRFDQSIYKRRYKQVISEADGSRLRQK